MEGQGLLPFESQFWDIFQMSSVWAKPMVVSLICMLEGLSLGIDSGVDSRFFNVMDAKPN